MSLNDQFFVKILPDRGLPTFDVTLDKEFVLFIFLVSEMSSFINFIHLEMKYTLFHEITTPNEITSVLIDMS